MSIQAIQFGQNFNAQPNTNSKRMHPAKGMLIGAGTGAATAGLIDIGLGAAFKSQLKKAGILDIYNATKQSLPEMAKATKFLHGGFIVFCAAIAGIAGLVVAACQKKQAIQTLYLKSPKL